MLPGFRMRLMVVVPAQPDTISFSNPAWTFRPFDMRVHKYHVGAAGINLVSFCLVTAPNPHERIGQRLLENAPVAVVGAEAEDETVVVIFGL